ncbi:hypothetical protein C5688_18935 [Methylocystis sp. MitZ-2018]|nr:hypothetical protein C5688_18935 [Methylocystis sp. MitZ-2018]
MTGNLPPAQLTLTLYQELPRKFPYRCAERYTILIVIGFQSSARSSNVLPNIKAFGAKFDLNKVGCACGRSEWMTKKS